MKGIEFTFNNGKKDWYDPVDPETDVAAAADVYLITVGATTYEIVRSDVRELRYYDLCPNCGRESANEILCDRCKEAL